ncbi:MAG: YqgE/AlgH family protein [Tannerella sp.]|jgi:putative transcriptional regulator|nr:YqgE/AlgH family protein [Tannerella sp.]
MAQYKDIFKIKHNNLSPEKGKILISEPFLQDAYFQRSVVLLIEHNTNGSMGFVLNKKAGLWVNDFFDGLENVPRIPIYLGGPVSSDHLYFIHSLGNIIPDSVQIDDNLYFDGDFESLNYYMMSGQPVDGKIKFFLGYSGWTESQLDGEISQDSWLVSKSSNRNIMLAEGESFWKHSVELIGGSYMTWINYPKDPILN